MPASICDYSEYDKCEAAVFQPPGTGNANKYNSSIEMSLQIDGTETLMFLEFCEKFNCTLEAFVGQSHSIVTSFVIIFRQNLFEIEFEDDVGEWGNIYENATGDGVLGAVAERRADIGFSALYSW